MARIDLSADMNGDLVVDAADVTEVVVNILDTFIGDVNLDGVVDQADVGIVTANQGAAGSYSDGDLNCDGVIDAEDLAIVNNALCPADLVPPAGVLNFFDVSAFLSAYNSRDPIADFAAPFGVFNFFDVSAFLADYNAGCP